MLLRKILILFFGLPASRLCGITVASQHFGSNIIVRLSLHSFSSSIKYALTSCCLFLITQTAYTQLDSNYVDTVSMQHIDTVAQDAETATYNDEDDGYVDTTVKHIYDTSQYFFNWKPDASEPFVKEKIAQRGLADAAVNEFKKDEDFWYIPAIEKLETRLKNDPKFRDSLLNAHNRELVDERQKSILYQPWFNNLLWIIMIGIFAAAIIYFLVQNKVNIFSGNAASAAGENNEDGHEDIFSLSYTKLIQNAEKQNDYRVAIRLMFLQTLKLLSDVNAIQYQPDYTDQHYLQQLYASKYYDDFFKVMHSYEYAWFGKFDIAAERYAVIKNEFIKLQNRIR